jgi:hypothetical protein
MDVIRSFALIQIVVFHADQMFLLSGDSSFQRSLIQTKHHFYLSTIMERLMPRKEASKQLSNCAFTLTVNHTLLLFLSFEVKPEQLPPIDLPVRQRL